MCVTQTTLSIILEGKGHGFPPSQRWGRKAEIGWVSIPTELNRTVILDQTEFKIGPNCSMWNEPRSATNEPLIVQPDSIHFDQ
jgi:hypothetical protein